MASSTPATTIPATTTSAPSTPAPSTPASRVIVITGSTKGIGYALAEEYLRQGHRLIITSRNQQNVHNTIHNLRSQVPREKSQNVQGCTCDVSKADQMEELGKFAVEKFGTVSVWINNAATTGKREPLIDLPVEELELVVGTNLMGTLLGCRTAMRIMREHHGGVIWNVDGSGSRGNATPGYSMYGATKRAIPHLTKTLSKECKKISSHNRIAVNTMSPGMVLTDLLLKGDVKTNKKVQWVFNIFAEEPETVAGTMVPKMRVVEEEFLKGGDARHFSNQYLKMLSVWGALGRFLAWFFLGRRQHRFWDARGNRIKSDGYVYNDLGVKIPDRKLGKEHQA